jgi:hypothetical protein
MKLILLLILLTSCSTQRIIIKQVTERGFISVMYKQGNKTFALDYIPQKEYDSLFVR